MSFKKRRDAFRARFRERLAKMSDEELLDVLFRTHELKGPEPNIKDQNNEGDKTELGQSN